MMINVNYGNIRRILTAVKCAVNRLLVRGALAHDRAFSACEGHDRADSRRTY